MKLNAEKDLKNHKDKGTLVVFLPEKGKKTKQVDVPEQFKDLLLETDLSYFRGKPSETLFFPSRKKPDIILCGVGPDEELTGETLRSAASAAVALCRSRSIAEAVFIPPESGKMDNAAVLYSLAEGMFLSNYSFEKYKARNEDYRPLMKNAVFITPEKKAAAILREAGIVCGNTLLCRDLVNEISEKANPDAIASVAKKLASPGGVKCTVFGKKELQKMKMGLLLAVNRGSALDPKLVVLTYNGNPGSRKHFAIVGKGITFDSGGMNLKSSGHIETMRMDMAGAAAALFTIKSAAELKLKKNIYAVMPLTENMISNEAYRPGDIITSYSGKTVEIGNTDAEGRLILADALAYTVKELRPDYIVDLATLTGACVTTFGETTAAYLTGDDYLRKLLKDASEKTGERIWELPLFPEYEELMKSDVADIANIGSERTAGTITGAVFLKNFVNKTKWAHIDIAGTAWYSKQRGYRPKNATGFGVRLMIEALKNS